jgi:hypothetical protein
MENTAKLEPTAALLIWIWRPLTEALNLAGAKTAGRASPEDRT